MNTIMFAMDINAILEDETEVTKAKGYVIDNKRVYKTNEGEILTGDKKIKSMKSQTITVPVELFIYINSMENI